MTFREYPQIIVSVRDASAENGADVKILIEGNGITPDHADLADAVRTYLLTLPTAATATATDFNVVPTAL